MNPPAEYRRERSCPKKVVFAGLLLASLLATGCFRVSSSTQALREIALENLDGFWEERIEFSAGRLTFAAAQWGSRFVELPPEARTILDSARGAEVSVWESERRGTMDGPAILKEADRKMTAKGWTRLVGVIEEQNLVAIYVPADLGGGTTVKISVLVINEQQVVCAAARSNIKPLMELAMGKMREQSDFLAARAK